MGRKAKYATLTKYQSYIDTIRRDLNLPDTLYVEVKFVILKRKGGYAQYYSKTYGKIECVKNAQHQWTVECLLHEFRHIWQSYTGKLQPYIDKPVFISNVQSDDNKIN
jgi:hypothetical protein